MLLYFSLYSALHLPGTFFPLLLTPFLLCFAFNFSVCLPLLVGIGLVSKTRGDAFFRMLFIFL